MAKKKMSPVLKQFGMWFEDGSTSDWSFYDSIEECLNSVEGKPIKIYEFTGEEIGTYKLTATKIN